jgi:hypothetical protein
MAPAYRKRKLGELCEPTHAVVAAQKARGLPLALAQGLIPLSQGDLNMVSCRG